MEDDKQSLDEIIAKAVRGFPVIYDKSKIGHKHILIVSNALDEVAKRCNLDDENTGKSLFDNLKKCCNKRRRAVNEANVSGTSRAEVTTSRKQLKEYDSLTWLQPYVQLRETKTNCPVFPENVFVCDRRNTHQTKVKKVTDPMTLTGMTTMSI